MLTRTLTRTMAFCFLFSSLSFAREHVPKVVLPGVRCYHGVDKGVGQVLGKLERNCAYYHRNGTLRVCVIKIRGQYASSHDVVLKFEGQSWRIDSW